MEITKLTALELGRKIQAGEISVEEAVRTQLDMIREREGEYHCYITVLEEEALACAKKVQEGIRTGEYTSPLAGVPIAVKASKEQQGGSRLSGTDKRDSDRDGDIV